MVPNFLYMSELLSCFSDCSGRGECHNGTCVCDIRFAGDHCDGPNVPYHAGIGGVFLVIALVCAIQLLTCIVSEYQQTKTPTWVKACRITTQKVLYAVAFFASLLRGAYFLSPSECRDGMANSLLSAYYPLLMSGCSLIICFWAEVFHIPNIRWERPQFLSKSFMGFVTFNIINYGLLVAEVLTTHVIGVPERDISFYSHLFNGCYAVLLFVVVIFFLVYGVEVYFKVRGGFVKMPPQLAASEGEPLNCTTTFYKPEIDNSQLRQSRIGLLSQALMMILIVGFLFSETLSEFWKTKVPVQSRNWHDVLFRVVEIGVAVWFPAVLWNCVTPAELWLLNPTKLLAKRDAPSSNEISVNASTSARASDGDAKHECWICYDAERTDDLIQPCACIGDVASVHHECLLQWLMESSAASNELLCCKVCKQAYNVRKSERLDWERGFTAYHWGNTAAIVTCLCVTVAVAWIVIQLHQEPYIRMLSASVAAFIVYICFKLLGRNTMTAYQRAKVGSLNIANYVTTISGNTVEVETEAQNL